MNETILAVEKVDPKSIKQALPYNFGKRPGQSDHFVLGLRRLASGKYSIVRWYRLSTDDHNKVPAWQREAIRKVQAEHNEGGLKSIFLIGIV